MEIIERTNYDSEKYTGWPGRSHTHSLRTWQLGNAGHYQQEEKLLLVCSTENTIVPFDIHENEMRNWVCDTGSDRTKIFYYSSESCEFWVNVVKFRKALKIVSASQFILFLSAFIFGCNNRRKRICSREKA